MKKTFKTIAQIFLVLIASILSLIAIAGFFDSWRTGVLWFVASLLLFVVSISISETKRIAFPKITNGLKVGLIVCSFIAFIFGATFLKPRSNRKELKQRITSKESSQIITPDTAKLRAFQEEWANLKINEWNGQYIKRSIFSSSFDTVYFQLIKEATKGNWLSAAQMNQSIYQIEYDSLVKMKFGNEFVNLKTQIKFCPDPQQQIENEAKQRRQHLIDRQFSGWDGSNVYVERYIKQNMNDPKSYEHIETSHRDKGDHILVRTKFRGSNALGVKVIQVVDAKVDIDGNVLSITY